MAKTPPLPSIHSFPPNQSNVAEFLYSLFVARPAQTGEEAEVIRQAQAERARVLWPGKTNKAVLASFKRWAAEHIDELSGTKISVIVPDELRSYLKALRRYEMEAARGGPQKEIEALSARMETKLDALDSARTVIRGVQKAAPDEVLMALREPEKLTQIKNLGEKYGESIPQATERYEQLVKSGKLTPASGTKPPGDATRTLAVLTDEAIAEKLGMPLDAEFKENLELLRKHGTTPKQFRKLTTVGAWTAAVKAATVKEKQLLAAGLRALDYNAKQMEKMSLGEARALLRDQVPASQYPGARAPRRTTGAGQGSVVEKEVEQRLARGKAKAVESVGAAEAGTTARAARIRTTGIPGTQVLGMSDVPGAAAVAVSGIPEEGVVARAADMTVTAFRKLVANSKTWKAFTTATAGLAEGSLSEHIRGLAKKGRSHLQVLLERSGIESMNRREVIIALEAYGIEYRPSRITDLFFAARGRAHSSAEIAAAARAGKPIPAVERVPLTASYFRDITETNPDLFMESGKGARGMALRGREVFDPEAHGRASGRIIPSKAERAQRALEFKAGGPGSKRETYEQVIARAEQERYPEFEKITSPTQRKAMRGEVKGIMYRLRKEGIPLTEARTKAVKEVVDKALGGTWGKLRRGIKSPWLFGALWVGSLVASRLSPDENEPSPEEQLDNYRRQRYYNERRDRALQQRELLLAQNAPELYRRLSQEVAGPQPRLTKTEVKFGGTAPDPTHLAAQMRERIAGLAGFGPAQTGVPGAPQSPGEFDIEALTSGR